MLSDSCAMDVTDIPVLLLSAQQTSLANQVVSLVPGVVAAMNHACCSWATFGSRFATVCTLVGPDTQAQRLGHMQKSESDMPVPAEGITSTWDFLQILRYCGGVGFTACWAGRTRVFDTADPAGAARIPLQQDVMGQGNHRKVWFQNMGTLNDEPDDAELCGARTDTHVNVPSGPR
jgi:hypothetical protein